MKRTLGIYTNFPNTYHGAAKLEFKVSLSNLQKAILNALHRLNGNSVGAHLSSLIGPDIEVIPEFGVADGLTFNYLDKDTLNVILDLINEGEVRILDFFCVIRYYKLKEKVRRALRFDYYFLRFLFGGDEFELQVFHEKGLERIPIEGLIKFLIENINVELLRKGASPIKIVDVWTI
jgi:hypothetical protein